MREQTWQVQAGLEELNHLKLSYRCRSSSIGMGSNRVQVGSAGFRHVFVPEGELPNRKPDCKERLLVSRGVCCT